MLFVTLLALEQSMTILTRSPGHLRALGRKPTTLACIREPVIFVIAEYVAKIHNLTCILQRLNRRKVVRSKILIQNVLQRQILTNSTAKLSPGAVNRGDVLTACFRDIQSQRSIRMEFVIIMILFDVKDYRLLYGSISLSPHSEKIYT